MFGLGLPEIAIVLIVVGILFFGGKRIGDFGRSLGRFTGEVKKGKAEVERELEEVKGSSKKS